MDWIELLNVLIAPATGVIGWIIGKRKRNNDFLHEMQKSINTLVIENTRLLDEIVTVKRQNAEVLIQNEILERKMGAMEIQNEKLQKSVNQLTLENEQLRKEVAGMNSKLDDVSHGNKTIFLP